MYSSEHSTRSLQVNTAPQNRCKEGGEGARRRGTRRRDGLNSHTMHAFRSATPTSTEEDTKVQANTDCFAMISTHPRNVHHSPPKATGAHNTVHASQLTSDTQSTFRKNPAPNGVCTKATGMHRHDARILFRLARDRFPLTDWARSGCDSIGEPSNTQSLAALLQQERRVQCSRNKCHCRWNLAK